MWFPPETPLEDQISDTPSPSAAPVFPRILLHDTVPSHVGQPAAVPTPSVLATQRPLPSQMVYPLLNGRPTQPALNRDQQKQAFTSLQGSYAFAQQPPPTPVLQHPTFKETAQSPEDLLAGYKARLQNYKLQTEVKAVEKTLEEKHTATTVKQFYCQHVFQPVRVQWMGLPIRYKICQTCGLVK